MLQWLRGGTRWVLKTPQHLEQFPALVDTFPDATFVVTHRDPVSVTASMATMVAYSARLTRDRVDLEAHRRLLVGPPRADAAPVRRGARRLPAGQTIDVHFDEFMADDMAMVERVYDLAGQPWTSVRGPPWRRSWRTTREASHGTVEYDLAEFGLDAAERRRPSPSTPSASGSRSRADRPGVNGEAVTL